MRRKSGEVTDDERQVWRKETAHDKLLRAEKKSVTALAEIHDTNEVPIKRPTVLSDSPMPQTPNNRTALANRKAPSAPLIPGKLDHLEPKRIKQLLNPRSKRDATLDLHGLSQEAAYEASFNFIEAAYARKKRQLRIITGKGSGILQEQLIHWLNDPKLRMKILAISHADPREGGEGALIVLLKRA